MTISKFTKIIILVSWIPICLIYYNNNLGIGYTYESKATAAIVQRNHKAVKKFNTTYKGTEKYLINTPGCYIPNYGKTFKFKESAFMKRTCGVRAVFVKKLENNKIELKIDKAKMNIYSHGKTYYCCIRFAAPQNVSGKINLTKLKYTSCTTFQNGSRIYLEQEIVTISCYSKSTNIYEDAYMILKKLVTSSDDKNSQMNSWNVLLLGVDTMSRLRLMSSMPETARYLREHDWLDFRAYQKVGYNTFPNVMSMMTGRNISNIYKVCSKGLDKCSKYLLWNKFKQAGYATAYGEESLQLPDTFSKYDGFQKTPTDHYMRPFFLTGETNTGNYVCTKKMTSVNHVLDYAYQFTDVYKKDKFYGTFWINSCSHNSNHNPALHDKDFLEFFQKIYNNGVMNNTFIIFISDHGIRYGSMRVQVQSYYEERLPMFYVWVPKMFRKFYPEMYRNLQLNQERLVTPYDVYLTMATILKVSQESNEIITSEGCPLCKSLFEEVSADRTCSDAGIHEKWCSCHDLIPIDSKKSDVSQSLQVITEELEKRTKNTKTKDCTECYTFKIKTTLRSHLYEDPAQNKTYYVIALLVSPGDIGYEAVVEKQSDQFSLIPFLDAITPYNSKGYCVTNSIDRGFCVCKTLCNKEVKTKTNVNKKMIKR